jgi:hypothetical protein
VKFLKLYLLSGFIIVGLGFASSATLAAGLESGIALSLGKRVDSLDWNISGENNPAGSDPNILSELEWRDLDIVLLKAEMTNANRDGFVFRGYIDYGWVMDGINQDSDYAGSNRTLEFSRSYADVDGSRVLDVSGGLGFTFFMGAAEQFQVIPMIGYSYHNQQLKMKNGNLVLWDSANAVTFDPILGGSQTLGSFAGLNSSYDAEWSGLWLGTDFVWQLQSGNTLFARLEAHRVNYFAQANWNLRSDFAHPVSFEHEANGTGSVLELGWQAAPVDMRMVWGVSVVMQSWTTDSGIDRTFGAGGGFGETKLNEVNWSSRSINVTLQKAFAN